MIKDAEINAESDKLARELIDQRNMGENLMRQVQKDLDEHGDKITAEDKTKIKEAIIDLGPKVVGDDLEALRKSIQDMFTAYGPLTEAKSKAEPAKGEEAVSPDGAVNVEASEIKPGA
jgi:molecular chaperone DnaK